jgi:hypothetical protein
VHLLFSSQSSLYFGYFSSNHKKQCSPTLSLVNLHIIKNSAHEVNYINILPHSFQKQVNLSFSTVSLATTCQAHFSVGKETIMRDIASSMQFVNILHLAIFFFSSNWNNGGKEPKRVSLVRLAWGVCNPPLKKSNYSQDNVFKFKNPGSTIW